MKGKARARVVVGKDGRARGFSKEGRRIPLREAERRVKISKSVREQVRDDMGRYRERRVTVTANWREASDRSGHISYGSLTGTFASAFKLDDEEELNRLLNALYPGFAHWDASATEAEEDEPDGVERIPVGSYTAPRSVARETRMESEAMGRAEERREMPP